MELACCRQVGLALIAVLTVALTGCGEPQEETTAAPLAQIASNGETAPAENGIDQLSPQEVLEAAIEGNIVADFPLCNKSFNCSYSGHDL
jgi:hypothetical protein